jgi:S-DNA-T family DNA segregation ATPase FtsK/SpoIIIE
LTKKKSSLISESVKARFQLSASSKKLLKDLFVLFQLLAGIIFSLSLWTFSIKDPDWLNASSSMEVSNSIGIVGAWISSFLYSIMGVTAWVISLILFINPINYFIKQNDGLEEEIDHKSNLFTFLGFAILCFSVSLLISLHLDPYINYFPQTSSGIIGNYLSNTILPYLSFVGTSIVAAFFFMVSLSLLINLHWQEIFSLLKEKMINLAFEFNKLSKNSFEAFKESRKKKNESKNRQSFLDTHKEKIKSMPKPEVKKAEAKIPEGKKVVLEKQVELFDNKNPGDMPKISLLDEREAINKEMSSQELYELEILKEALITKLAEFKVTGPEGEYAIVRETMRGPVVTRFEVELPKGIKVSQVSNLNKDLARSLGVGSIRIVEVIEGRETIGVEIPNADRESVLLGEVIASKEFEESKSPITLAYGKDIEGKPVLEDLASLPHLLIAGTTGSGKSVALNAMLMSILYKATPQEVKLVLIDPKMLELSVYEDLPHLLCPVITDMSEAAYGLRWCVNEMERRYKLMSAMSVRNLSGYNAKINKAIASGNPIKDPTVKVDEEKGITAEDIPDLVELPQIVIGVDELADLMMVVGKKVEQLIARLAQKARAAGIHMLLATQRPSVDVITGLIKANISARMAFNVASSMDSRVVLDQVGAEQLLGKGDMLYVGSGTSIPLRVHGAFVGEEEIIRVVSDWKERESVKYLDEVTKAPEVAEGAEGQNGDSEKDEFYDQAVAFVVESRRASISAVQRKFRIGYNRAARLIETMEAAGLVSEMNSNGNREVLAPSNAE